MNATENKTVTLNFDEILDTTVEVKLSERQQFERFLSRREKQRMEVEKRFNDEGREIRCMARLTKSI